MPNFLMPAVDAFVPLINPIGLDAYQTASRSCAGPVMVVHTWSRVRLRFLVLLNTKNSNTPAFCKSSNCKRVQENCKKISCNERLEFGKPAPH